MFIKVILPIIVIAIAVGALVGFKLSQKPASTDTTTTEAVNPEPKVADQQAPSALAGKLIVFTKDKQLAALDLATKQTTPIVTNDKIRFAKTAPKTSSLITLETSSSTSANAMLFDAATQKSSKLAEFSLSSSPPTISPDAKEYITYSFSNFEVEYGWHLFLNTVGSTQKTEVFSTAETITAATFSPDGKTLLIAISKAKGGSELTSIDIAAKKPTTLYTTDNEITSVAWGDNTIFVVEAPKGKAKANQSEIYQLDQNGKNKKQLTTNDTAESFLTSSADGKFLGYLSATYPNGNVTSDFAGKVTVYDTTTGQTTSFDDALMVAGFTQ